MDSGTDDNGKLRTVKETQALQALTTQKLRNAILAGHFKPEQRLIERDLCERTGVSRTCVREALRHLESEGIVERRQNEGIFVASVSLEEARQIYEVRAALESSMARLFVARATDKDLDALQAALDGIEAAVSDGRDTDYVDGLDHFYSVLIEGSGNKVTLKLIRSLRARIAHLRTITTRKNEGGRRLETLRLLKGIVDAATTRDPELIAERCYAFVERSANYALQILRAHNASMVPVEPGRHHRGRYAAEASSPKSRPR